MYVRFAIAVLCFSPALFAQTVASLDAAVQPETESLDQLYLYLHQHPELSYHETGTAARIAVELKSAGFAVTTGVGGNGVVGVLKNGPGPTVLVRTDLDALPVEERTGRPYASKVQVRDESGNEVGVMHACGHDIHMSVFTGTARTLSKLRDQWHGTLIMIGQPAEERGGGARAMLKDGLFTRFPRPDFNLALHTDAALETGKIGFHPGYVMASVDSVDVTIRGAGGHGAYPHLTKDPVVIAAETVLALQTIVSREIRPLDPAVVTVGSIHGGSKHNVIPDEVKLQLTVRSYSPQVRDHILAAIPRICRGIAIAAGVPDDRMPIVQIENEHTPSTYNDPALVTRLVPVWRNQFGAANVVERDPEMGGEDFSEYGLVDPKIPSFLFRLGTIDAARIQAAAASGRNLPSLHSSEYWPVPEPTIRTGVEAMTAAVLELMKK